MKSESNPQLKLTYDFVQYTGRNIFLTGKAGTGKTTFLHDLKNVSHKRMVVVAPTGVAAINAKGVTIHSFFQLPFGPQVPGFESESMQLKNRRFNKEKINIIRSMDLLVIDEISMVRADLLDGIDSTLRRFRNRDIPFGGVQLLMIGDLQQLAPVVKENEWNLLRSHYDTAFFFSSKALQQTEYVSIELLHVYRQSDEKFIKLLNSVRNNNLDNSVIEALNSRYDPDFNSEEAGYIILTTHNAKANQINQSRLSNLKNKSHSFNANITGNFPEFIYPTEYELILKEGAQVMFIKNDPSPEKKYYNGKIGTITSISNGDITVECTGDDEPIIVDKVFWEKMKYSLDKNTKEIEETIEGTFVQYPLKLAWAITIHKSQGLTFEHAVIDAQAAFAHGQVYVALSRCKTLEGMVLSSPIQPKSVKHDNTIKGFITHVEDNQPDEKQLEDSKIQYQEQLLLELFDFNTLQRHIYYIIKLLREHESSLTNSPLKEFTEIRPKIFSEIIQVSEIFKRQLLSLFINTTDAEKDEPLQTRIKKASSYFSNKFSEILEPIVSNTIIETDNKVVKKSIKRVLDNITYECLFKSKCLKACNVGFIIDDYQKARALASIEEPNTSVKKKAQTLVSDGSDENRELYRILKAWRDAKADELDWQVYRVIQLKTMNEICDRLPSNPIALKQIRGMGKVKMEMFSDELLDIINDFREENNFSPTKEEEEPKLPVKIPKKDTKKISFELWNSGKSIDEIAKERGFVISTIEGHLSYFVGKGELSIDKILKKDMIKLISNYIKDHPSSTSTEIRTGLKEKVSYSEIRFVLQHLTYVNSKD